MDVRRRACLQAEALLERAERAGAAAVDNGARCDALAADLATARAATEESARDHVIATRLLRAMAKDLRAELARERAVRAAAAQWWSCVCCVIVCVMW